ncbi:oxidative stress survival, Svf1-like protein [Coniochaeta sp. 2T2.1]|nr:oxidative stress survival, Svf1-like protein [Coniochaeta sp. 2T2.1]
MFKWAQQQLANVAGTQEPIYGPEAIKSVAEEAKHTPYTELTKDHLKWQVMDSTCVETQTFYIHPDNGQYVGLVQVIYSNVAGIRTTCQFNSKIFYLDGSKPHLWCSTPLKNTEFSEDRNSFFADDCALELSTDGETYSVKSMTDPKAVVNLTFKRSAPGFHVGSSGKTLFGTDLENPWGTMRHAFWPRCAAEGTIMTQQGPLDFKGKACFIMALQGMKPHHAAAKWNFLNFQGPNHSAVLMQFTTPPSYGSTVVNVGGVVKDGEIVVAGADVEATHLTSKQDSENGWPEPQTVRYTWAGTCKHGKDVKATIEGSLGERVDKVDVMAEVPQFVKTIVGGVAGTKPYIYQYAPQKEKLSLKLKIGEHDEIVEQGEVFSEATFITVE